MLSPLHALTHVILTKALWNKKHHYPYLQMDKHAAERENNMLKVTRGKG